MSDPRMVVVDGIRTPFCKWNTHFASVGADELGRIAVSALLTRTGLDPQLIDEVIFGCVSQPAEAMNIARVIALRAGIPESVPALTVHRNCASGLEAVTLACERMASGHGSVFIVGGAENMSQVPLFFKQRTAKKYGALAGAKSIFKKLAALAQFRPSDFEPRVGLKLGLTDPVSGMNMGETAELLAREHKISREAQDQFAVQSHQRAIAAREKLAQEICPVYLKGKAITEDNGPRADSSLPALAKLKPVFDRHCGTVTAGNSSQISDGAVALLVMTEQKAKELGCQPLGRIGAYAYTGCDPARMGLGPVSAIRKAGRPLADADLIEINEAFAAQVLSVMDVLGDVPMEKLNVNGGAIALGHPVGATGARLVLTALKELQRRDAHRAVVSLCVGGGQGARFGWNVIKMNIHREMADGRFCVLRFDQADAKANIFNQETLAELDGHIRAIADDRAVEGVVFISAKDRIFHAGADVHAFQKLKETDLQRFLEMGQGVFNRIASLKVPTVAAIHGVCLGGGCELALACDYRIATSDRATKIGLPETKLGILPAWGGSTRLPRLIGVISALDIILGGKTPAAKQALRYGMIDAIVPKELLLAAALKLVRRGRSSRRTVWWHRPLPNRLIARVIAPRVQAKVMSTTRGHYPAVVAAAEVVLAAPRSSVSESLAHERDAVIKLIKTEACQNLVRLFFMGERARKSDDAKGRPVKSAAVIGAGVMGAGIAQWLSSRGVRVILRDVNFKALAAGMERIQKLFGNRRIFSEKEARDGMDRISPAIEASLGHVDLVIEAAVEKMEPKKQIFSKLDEQAGNTHTLLATNTSALSLAEIAGATKNPGRVVGIHFFNPVHKMQLVEVVAGAQADLEAIQRAAQFVRQIGKLPVMVKDSPGFLVNRILMPYLLEAGLLFENGARETDIDETMLDFGMPMGPLRLIDEVGVDIADDVASTLVAKFPDRLRVPEILARMVSAGWLGRKSGRGFYVYSGKKTAPHARLHSLCHGRSAVTLSRSELQRRLVLLLVNEAARCVEERIAANPEAIDFAMVMGTGFPPFRGGPLRHAETYGLRRVVDELEQLRVTAGPSYARSDLLQQLAAEGRRFYED